MNDRGGKLFYGWIMVGVCFVINFIVFGIANNTFSVYVKPLEADFGWSRAQISLAVMFAALAMGGTAPFVGRLIDRTGARLVMAAGAAIVGTSFLLLSRAQSLPYFYAMFALVGIGQAGATMIPISLVISNWFSVKRGRALGIAMTGTGLGAMVMVPVTTQIILRWGWRTSVFVMGCIILLMVPVGLLFIRTRPSDMGLMPDGGLVPEEEPAALEGLTLGEAFKTPAFKLIGAMIFLFGLAAMGINVHLMAYLTDIGHPETIASYIIGIMSGLTVAGKLGTGFIVDRWGIRRSVVLTYVTIAVGIFLLLGSRDLLVARIFAVVFGFGIGAPLVVNPALTAECLGLKNFGAIFGILTLLITIGVAIGAVFTGVVFDKSGSYLPAFSLFIILIAIAGFCGAKAKKAFSAEPVPTEGT